jgi:glucosamine--fructose-6-phosphate aminotransferase (isomerizing)
MSLDQKIALCLTEDKIAQIRYYAEQYFKVRDAFFIGRNLDSAICLEGSLKLKEIAYIHSEAYAAGELKHGPISLIEEGTLVVAVATVEALFDKTMSNVKEVRARGAEVFGVTTEKLAEEIKKTIHNMITVPETHPLLQPSLTIIPLQIFAYHMALLRGCDVDKPRNLAKSVTVE